MLLEVKVHSVLRDFLRKQGEMSWPHYLTMARLVARALRLGRPALIQTGSSMFRYCVSYLTPALLSPQPIILVIPTTLQQRLLEIEIPSLQQILKTDKIVLRGNDWSVSEDFSGLMITSPESWLSDRLENQGRFPLHILTLIDPADDLEAWTRKQLTIRLDDQDWEELRQNFPQQADWIRDVRIKLTKAIYDRPQNPYNCWLIEGTEKENLYHFFESLALISPLSHQLENFSHGCYHQDTILWATIKNTGHITLQVAPVEVATYLRPLWEQQPIILIGQCLDLDKNASIYRQQIGLDLELTPIKFPSNRQSDPLQLYLPDRLPMPNNPVFHDALLSQIHQLISCLHTINKPIILLINDVPLKSQISTQLAAEFGSRVQVEKIKLSENGILVSGWEFWQQNQEKFPAPQLLVITTLPIPSLENPLVSARVSYYKRQRQDWFRLYLLPTALRAIQRAVFPLRDSQGMVALLDNRVNYRSYGQQILMALEPYAKINYIDPNWFN